MRSPGVAGAVEVDQDRIQRTGCTYEQMVALSAAEGEVGRDLRNMELSDQRAVRVEAVQPVRGRRPDPAVCVETDAVEGASIAGCEDLTAGDRGGAGHAEDPDVLAPAVGNVKLPFVCGERQPVGAFEVVRDHLQRSGGRVKPVHVTSTDLTVGPVALV